MTKAGRNGRRMKGQFHDHVKFVQISQFVQIFFHSQKSFFPKNLKTFGDDGENNGWLFVHFSSLLVGYKV